MVPVCNHRLHFSFSLSQVSFLVLVDQWQSELEGGPVAMRTLDADLPLSCSMIVRQVCRLNPSPTPLPL